MASLSEQPALPKRSQFHIRLDPELDRELRKIVLASGRTLNKYVADLIARDIAAQREPQHSQA